MEHQDIVASVLAGLRDNLTRHVLEFGFRDTAVPGLKIARSPHPTEPEYRLQEPVIYVVVQGCKEVVLGCDVYRYEGPTCLAVTTDLLTTSRVLTATPEQPYLSLTLSFEPRELATMVAESGASRDPDRGGETGGLFLSRLNVPLLDAFRRLTALLDAPDDIALMAPLIMREIGLRLLQEDNSGRLAQMAMGESRLRRVAGAMAWIRQHFSERLMVDDLARIANMSVSGFHHHFKSVTAMSPLQYQKRLRLQEARRIMLADDADVATAAHLVGYESASQFNREYSRLFGQSPFRDVKQLRVLTLLHAL